MRIAAPAFLLAAVASLASTLAVQPEPIDPVDMAFIQLERVPDQAIRDRAELVLIRHADRIADRLRVAAESTDHADTLRRLARIQTFIGGGEAVDGLRVRLDVDRAAVQLNGQATLTTTLMNLTDKPMQVEVGYSTEGVYFQSGSALGARYTDARTGTTTPAKPQWNVGFCGTGAVAIVKTIPAMSMLTYQTPAKLTRIAPRGEEPAPDAPIGLVLGESGYCYIPVNADGTLTLRMARTNRLIEPAVKPEPQVIERVVEENGERVVVKERVELIVPFERRPEIDPDVPYWHGAIESNAVELKVMTTQLN